MPTLLLVGTARDSHADNFVRLERVFNAEGWQVTCVEHDELVLNHARLQFVRDGCVVANPVAFDWIWLLGFGPRASFLDRMQLLAELPRAKFVNSVEAFLRFHNKAALAQTNLSEFSPRTIVASDAAVLLDQVAQGGRWIAKPTAGSFGRDVFELSAEDPNVSQILEHLTRNSYAMLQERVSTDREQRWFLVRGNVLGAYQKIKPGLRGNLRAGSTVQICQPNDEEVQLAQSIAEELGAIGIHAGAVDIAYPYLLDVNFVNPGWFETMEKLTGHDYACRLPELLEQTK